MLQRDTVSKIQNDPSVKLPSRLRQTERRHVFPGGQSGQVLLLLGFISCDQNALKDQTAVSKNLDTNQSNGLMCGQCYSNRGIQGGDLRQPCVHGVGQSETPWDKNNTYIRRTIGVRQETTRTPLRHKYVVDFR
ncbi:hypothetical protein EYF80_010196 [Liparis tanakae]|uniref:Uncharacterized protein n=1 Tax=Liparis tanakae TaxID=230148 RepID=A0A4Z2IQ30_9TELE|nr:hypothetical protein EYF80_010196 [Liparis tanakae]